MRKILMIIVSICCLVTFMFTVFYAYRIFYRSYADFVEDKDVGEKKTQVVMIAQEMESPFAQTLHAGSIKAANDNHINVNYWGTYRSNPIEILKYMDIAIASKVNGLIVQAMDGPEFIRKVQTATEKGIPVITVGLDAPDSLRKTYIGPNHVSEGQLIGERLAKKMGGGGTVCIVAGNKLTSFEKSRLNGINDVLANYPAIQALTIEPDEAEVGQSKLWVNRVFNKYPNVKVFVALNAETGVGIVQALKERGRIEDFSIYMFDDTPEIRDLIDSGQIEATLINDGFAIGETSITLLKQWIQNDHLPLPRNYYTQVRFYEKNGGS